MHNAKLKNWIAAFLLSGCVHSLAEACCQKNSATDIGLYAIPQQGAYGCHVYPFINYKYTQSLRKQCKGFISIEALSKKRRWFFG